MIDYKKQKIELSKQTIQKCKGSGLTQEVLERFLEDYTKLGIQHYKEKVFTITPSQEIIAVYQLNEKIGNYSLKHIYTTKEFSLLFTQFDSDKKLYRYSDNYLNILEKIKNEVNVIITVNFNNYIDFSEQHLITILQIDNSIKKLFLETLPIKHLTDLLMLANIDYLDKLKELQIIKTKVVNISKCN